MSTCPSLQLLTQYANGDCEAPQQATQIERHIDTCADCALRISTVLRSTDELANLLRQPNPLQNYHDDHHLRKLVAISTDVSQPLQSTSSIRHFLIREKIGEGGMGIVYRAWDKINQRTVAIKTVRSPQLSAELAERFRIEIQTCARVSHPHVVSVFESGTWQGVPYYVMEYLAGNNLVQRIDHEPLSTSSSVAIAVKLTKAVSCCHEAGVLHRDINPSNVFMSPNDEPVLGDFGISKFLDCVGTGLTSTGQAVGTPAYMSPEQRGDGGTVDHRSDVYGIGVTLAYCLVKSLWHSNPNYSESQAIICRKTIRNHIQDKDLREICLKCMTSQMDARYQSAKTLLEDLNRWREGQRTEALRERKRRHRRRFIAGGIVAGACVGVGLSRSLLNFVRPSMVRAQFYRGHQVSLLNAKQPIFRREVFVDQCQLSKKDAGCSFQSKTAAGCVLFEQPGVPYRLEAKLCHKRSYEGDAGVGFFLAYRLVSQKQYSIIVKYNDIHRTDKVLPQIRDALPKMNVIPGNKLRMFPYEFDETHKFPDTKLAGDRYLTFKPALGAEKWRQFSCVVDADSIEITFDDRPLIYQRSNILDHAFPAEPFCDGTLGIYVFASEVVFKDVTITQIPEEN